mmetsp:Transcript_31421/g.66490  ORF Transcript_31421/g.66490 Transcript_31421/m.66490 type:complete len:217 (+) Transcript_31421:1760-2410(+)
MRLRVMIAQNAGAISRLEQLNQGFWVFQIVFPVADSDEVARSPFEGDGGSRGGEIQGGEGVFPRFEFPVVDIGLGQGPLQESGSGIGRSSREEDASLGGFGHAFDFRGQVSHGGRVLGLGLFATATTGLGTSRSPLPRAVRHFLLLLLLLRRRQHSGPRANVVENAKARREQERRGRKQQNRRSREFQRRRPPIISMCTKMDMMPAGGSRRSMRGW